MTGLPAWAGWLSVMLPACFPASCTVTTCLVSRRCTLQRMLVSTSKLKALKSQQPVQMLPQEQKASLAADSCKCRCWHISRKAAPA